MVLTIVWTRSFSRDLGFKVRAIVEDTGLKAQVFLTITLPKTKRFSAIQYLIQLH
jgi:hypothetical protein